MFKVFIELNLKKLYPKMLQKKTQDVRKSLTKTQHFAIKKAKFFTKQKNLWIKNVKILYYRSEILHKNYETLCKT